MSQRAPKRQRSCRNCFIPDPHGDQALPFDESTQSYHTLLQSQSGVAYQDQGSLAPPPLIGAHAPIVYDNLIPYGPAYLRQRKPNGHPYFHRSPTVRVSRTPYADRFLPIQYRHLPSFDHLCEVTFDSPDCQPHSTFFDIICYHRDISLLFNNDWSTVPPDFKFPQLYSTSLKNQFNCVELYDALNASSTLDDQRSRRELVECAFFHGTSKSQHIGKVVHWFPVQQLEALQWTIAFPCGQSIELDDIQWNVHQFVIAANSKSNSVCEFNFKLRRATGFVRARVFISGKLSTDTLRSLVTRTPLFRVEPVSIRYPHLDVPNPTLRRLLAVYILNVDPGDQIEVLTSPTLTPNVDWHAREFLAIIPCIEVFGRKGCLAFSCVNDTSARAHAVVANFEAGFYKEPVTRAYQGQSAPHDPRHDQHSEFWRAQRVNTFSARWRWARALHQAQRPAGNVPAPRQVEVTYDSRIHDAPFIRWQQGPIAINWIPQLTIPDPENPIAPVEDLFY